MRILIAEDDLTTRTILTGVLKKWGYDVVVVHDGLAAWEALQQPDAPRLVLLDWVMPKMDGLEVIRQVRATFVDQQPYILLLTSKGDTDDMTAGLDMGANDYIKKPFDHQELKARIRVGQRTLELQNRLYVAQQNLTYLATHDPLTGILNRRAILEQLSKELSRTRREENAASRLCIGFFDIDHFKQINDQYGHQAGDEVLCAITDILASQIREYDTFGRMGGDEFLVLIPGTHPENCKLVFDRISAAVAGTKIATGAGEVSVAISIGVVLADAESSTEHLLDAADAAMYRAKREGGNRVVVVK